MGKRERERRRKGKSQPVMHRAALLEVLWVSRYNVVGHRAARYWGSSWPRPKCWIYGLSRLPKTGWVRPGRRRFCHILFLSFFSKEMRVKKQACFCVLFLLFSLLTVAIERFLYVLDIKTF